MHYLFLESIDTHSNMTKELFFDVEVIVHGRNLISATENDAFFETPQEKL